jgi:hypothetical protein
MESEFESLRIKDCENEHWVKMACRKEEIRYGDRRGRGLFFSVRVMKDSKAGE